MGFILMYDITNEESFNSVQDWVTQIKNYSWDNAQVILVGNKCDMEEERVISSERGKQLAEQLGVRFFETSAKENINVKVHASYIHIDEPTFAYTCPSYRLECNSLCLSFRQAVFEQLVDIICDKMSESLDHDPNLMTGGQNKGQRLTDQPTNPANTNCNC